MREEEINPSDSVLLKRIKKLEKDTKRLLEIIDNLRIALDMLKMDVERLRREKVREHPKFPEPYIPPNYPITPDDWGKTKYKVTVTSNK